MEIRKDYILERWIIISERRGKRPQDFVTNIAPDAKKNCVFCGGNEDQTPAEIYRVEKNKKWQVRVIPNKFAAVEINGSPIIQTHNLYYTFGDGYGSHEVVIETPLHGKNYGDLSNEEMTMALKTYALRIEELQKKAHINYVCLFKNQGKDAGASVNHPHSQIISMAMIPPVVQEKLDAVKRYPYCPYCDIISKEKDSFRRCFENDSFIAFTPYASRFNYEVWIFPKHHIKSFKDFSEKSYADLADVLKKLTVRLESINAAYDIEWYYSPKNEDLHFHIEILPRISIWAGLEMGFGVDINSVSPENAAKFYRGEQF